MSMLKAPCIIAFCIGFLLLAVPFYNTAQTELSDLVLNATFSPIQQDYKVKRRWMRPIKTGPQKFNPVFYIGSTLMYIYQNALSEQLSGECMFSESCSSYAKHRIEQYGFLKGTLMGAARLSQCVTSGDEDFAQWRIHQKTGKIKSFDP